MESNKQYQDAESVIEAIKNGTLPKDFSDWEMRDSDGIPVAFEGARAGLLPDSFDNWSLEARGTTVAHIAAWEGTLPANFSQWDIKDKHGDPVAMDAAKSPTASLENFNDWELSNGRTTVAHVAAYNGKLPDNFDKWDLLSKDGNTVAHVAARDGTLPADFSQWGLKEKGDYGHTVAHVAAIYGNLPENFDQWDLRNNQGYTVAHTATEYNKKTPSEDQLYLANNSGWTVAHAAAREGVLPEGFNDWGFAGDSGISVAHVAAKAGKLPGGFEKWDDQDYRGNSVAHYAAGSLSIPFGFDNWDLKNKPSNNGVIKEEPRTVREVFGRAMITGKDDPDLADSLSQSQISKSLTPFLEQNRIKSFSTAQRSIIATKIKNEMSNNKTPDVEGIVADVVKNKEKLEKEFYSEKSPANLNGRRTNLALAVKMVLRNTIPDDFKSWDIRWKGLPIAHYAVTKKELPSNFDQWDIKDNRKGDTFGESVIGYYMRRASLNEKLPESYVQWFDKKYKQSPSVAFENVKHLPPGFSDWDRRMPPGVANNYGNKTIAHEAAEKACLPPDFDKWGMADENGNTVAHVAASACARLYRYDPWNVVLPKDLEHWHAKNVNGEMVIDVARKHGGGSFIEETYAAALANGMASSIHGAAPAPELSYKEAAQALRDGTLPADFNDWSKKNSDGWTIAHAAAALGKLPPDFKDWSMEGAKPGVTVAHIAMRYSELPPSFNDWGLKDASGKTLGEVAVKHSKLGAEYQARIEASKQAQQPNTEARAPEPQAAKPSSEAQAQGGKSNQAAPIETSSTGRITGGGRFSRPPDLSNREPEPERRPIKAFISRGM